MLEQPLISRKWNCICFGPRDDFIAIEMILKGEWMRQSQRLFAMILLIKHNFLIPSFVN